MKIIGLANNYKGMADEDLEPVIFWKGDYTTRIYDGDEIIIPSNFELVWPEVELAVLNTVEGLKYGVAIDITADSLEKRDVHLPKSKAVRTFCPTGEFWRYNYKPNSDMWLYVNGESVQENNLRNIRYNPEKAIELVKKYFSFEVGDMIITGTPPHPYFNLKDGDTIHAGIADIGSVLVTVKRE